MPSLVGLYSPAPGSGKTAIASYLIPAGYKRVSFAATIKKMVVVLLRDLGIPEDEANRLVHEDKHETIPQIKASARHLLQTLGTEYGRSCVHPDLWLMCWQTTVQEHLRSGLSVVCDDVRFPNEAQLVRSLGGELWLITRPGVERQGSHASEGALDDFPYFDRRIVNDGSLLNLHQTVHRVLDATQTVPVLTS